MSGSECTEVRCQWSHSSLAMTLAAQVQVMELLNELIDEMELAEDAIIAKAIEHIHANEVILTFGLSKTTLQFLLKAAERRTFQVRSSIAGNIARTFADIMRAFCWVLFFFCLGCQDDGAVLAQGAAPPAAMSGTWSHPLGICVGIS
jgi:hypothetical protein